MSEHEHDLDPTQNTRDWVGNAINSLRSEMRLLFVLSVAGNQLLSHLTLSTTVAYISNGALIAAVVIVKGLHVWAGR